VVQGGWFFCRAYDQSLNHPFLNLIGLPSNHFCHQLNPVDFFPQFGKHPKEVILFFLHLMEPVSMGTND